MIFLENHVKQQNFKNYVNSNVCSTPWQIGHKTRFPHKCVATIMHNNQQKHPP